MLSRPRLLTIRLLAAVLPLSAVLLAGCGGSSGSTSSQPAPPPTTQASSTPGSPSAQQCQDLAAKYPDQVATLRVIPPNVLAALRKNPGNTVALTAAQEAVVNSDLAKNPAAALQRTLQLQQTSPEDVKLLIGCLGGTG